MKRVFVIPLHGLFENVVLQQYARSSDKHSLWITSDVRRHSPETNRDPCPSQSLVPTTPHIRSSSRVHRRHHGQLTPGGDETAAVAAAMAVELRSTCCSSSSSSSGISWRRHLCSAKGKQREVSFRHFAFLISIDSFFQAESNDAYISVIWYF